MGVVSGPLMPTMCSAKAVTVASGSHDPVSSKAVWPASTSIHSMRRPPPRLATAASSTDCAAGQMSTPIPSPRMKGMIGSSGTTRMPSAATEMRSA